MGCAAGAAEIERCRAVMGSEVVARITVLAVLLAVLFAALFAVVGAVLFAAAAEDAVEQHDALAPLRLGERFPERRLANGFAAARPFAGELEVLEKGNEIVLSAGCAGGDWKVGVALAFAALVQIVLGSKPEFWPAPARREAHHCAADAAHEGMHHRAQERAVAAARCSAERQPGEDFLFAHRPSDQRLESFGQCAQFGGRGEQFGQLPGDFVAGKGSIEQCRPLTLGQR